MSEKRMVTTFKIRLVHWADQFEGPVVSPDRLEVAENLDGVHEILSKYGGLFVYDKQWTYVPLDKVLFVQRGGRMFSLPWPLRDGNQA